MMKITINCPGGLNINVVSNSLVEISAGETFYSKEVSSCGGKLCTNKLTVNKNQDSNSNHPVNAKFTDAQVADIRFEYQYQKKPIKELAKNYKVSESCIKRLVRNESYYSAEYQEELYDKEDICEECEEDLGVCCCDHEYF